MIIKTIKDWDYTQIDDRLFKHDGCIVDVGCVGWDWCGCFIGKKRVIGIDPYAEAREGTEFVQGLLGGFTGKASVSKNGHESTAAGFIATGSSLEFPVLNWKTFCKKYHVDKVSALKVNIEGGEYSLLNSLDAKDFEKIDQIAVSFHDWMNPDFLPLTNSTVGLLQSVGYDVQRIDKKWGWHLAIKDIKKEQSQLMKKNTTIVTGLWDLGRGNLTGWATRDFQQYKDKFFQLLETDVNMCIWIPRDLEAEVWQIRKPENTKIYFKELEDFKVWNPFFDKIQEIRNKSEWKNFAGWLAESPQAALEFYNPMMMCKMFMVNDSAIMNPFGSNYFYWIDGGITSTVNQGYFTADKVFDKLWFYSQTINKITMIGYPYTCNDEIHGFERKAMAQQCGVDYVDLISRGGFFGGKKEHIHKLNGLYYQVLADTLTQGLMGADECLFTILAYRYPELIERFKVEGNGLIWPFFEHLKNMEVKFEDKIVPKEDAVEVEYVQTAEELEMNNRGDGVNLYIVTFNFPAQLQMLFDSMEKANPELLQVKGRYLIDNSIDETTRPTYDEMAKKYGFEVTRNGNMGICGSRQWAAQHFHDSDAKYMVWFEDDMLMVDKVQLCRNGLNMHVDNWLEKCIKIVESENLDFIKVSFSEFFGDHHKQWAWHNVPQDVKNKYFADGTHRMKWHKSGCVDGVSYLIGDVFYSNWPSVMSKAGNYKIFLETVYAHPMEQTTMSHCFQMSMKGRIRSAVLMNSLVNHNRVHHYKKEERKEC